MFFSKLRSCVIVGALSAGTFVGTAASAANYSVDVLYGSPPVLVAGSDVPGSFSLLAGDSFDYTLSAESGKAWRVTASNPLFAVFALATKESAQRTGDFTLTLSLNGNEMQTISAIGAVSSYVHAGANTVNLAVGTMFDSFKLSYTLTSAEEAVDDGTFTGHYVLTGNTSDTTLNGLLPIFGAPQSSAAISYISAVPEPSQIALLVAGLGIVGAVARRRQAVM